MVDVELDPEYYELAIEKSISQHFLNVENAAEELYNVNTTKRN